MLLTATERLTMNTRPKNPANARNLNFCGIGSSGSGKTRFWLTPQLLQAHSSYVVVDPKGGVLGQVGAFLQRRGYKIKVFNSIDFSKSMHYNPLAYIKTEADILKFVNALISNTKGEGKEGDPFWTKAETLLYATASPLSSRKIADIIIPARKLLVNGYSGRAKKLLAIRAYYHRSIQDIFNLCFRAGFVIDGFYEECFKTNKEIPMVMIVRLKKVKRDSLK